MFQTLIESRAARTRSIGGSMVSIAAHAGIVGALVIATAQATVAHVVEQRETAVKFTDVAPPTNLDNFTGIGKPGGRADGLEGATGVAPALSGVFLESEVEKPVVVLSGTAGPAYPESLRAAGIEGQVMAQFVVDSAGRVELATFQVLDRQHPLFVAAVRSALSRMRYLPAEARGARVAQLVQQSFHFTVRRD